MRARLCSFFRLGRVLALALTMASLGPVAQAQTRMTYKSALAGTAYHQMGSELAQAIRQGSDETLLLTNEESQGSVQNIQEVMNRQERYVFTAPPALVAQAQAGEGVFASHDSERFGAIRGLFPVPSLTMHFVMAGDDGTTSIDALSGKHVLIGRGTYGRPWFPSQVIHFLKTGEHLPDPAVEAQYAMVRRHYDDILTHYGVHAGVKIARKHIGWYSKGLPNSAEFRADIMGQEDPEVVRGKLADFYLPLLEKAAA